MSLRTFHLVFIAVSVVLAAFVAAWAAGMYRAAHETSYIAACVGAVASGLALSIYGAAFQKKMRRLQ